MSIFHFDATEMLIPDADDLGHKIGEFIPKLLGRFGDVLKNRGLPLELPDAIVAALPRIITMAAGGTEISLGILPQGRARDVLEKYLNTMLDNVGKGAADAIKTGDTKSFDGTKPVDASRKGTIDQGVWFPLDCTHPKAPPPFAKKGEAAAPRIVITLVEALRRGHGWCERGCVSTKEVGEAKVALAASAAPDVPKPDGKTTPDANPTVAKPQAVIVGNIGEHWQRLMKDVPHAMFTELLRLYQEAIAKDHSMAMKFHELAGRDYEDFKFVITQPPSQWKIWLDSFIGKPKNPGVLQSLKQALTDTFGEMGSREQQQTDEMIDRAGDMLDKGKEAVADARQKFDPWLAQRQEEREERRKKRKGKPFPNLLGLLLPALAVLAIYFLLNR